MATYSATPASDIPLVCVTATSGRWQGYTVLHAEGCQHIHRGDDPRPFGGVAANEQYADDFYAVALCAKAGRRR